MAKGQWWESYKNPPKWLVLLYLVSAILFSWLMVNRVVQGRNWGVIAPFAFLFWFKAGLFWHQRRRMAKSQELRPD
jgi:uncharacterized membrane protein (DUF4010 family)